MFVDESAANERTADRRRGWSPRGQPCRVRSPLGRSKRWSILPAITADDGYITYSVFHGSFDTERFNAFIEYDVLPQMAPFPAPRSVLVMDNCRTHTSERLEILCAEYGVLLYFLPPYSPDYNPIEASFSALKAWMRRHYQLSPALGEGNFEDFIRLACDSFMSGRTAHGWFKAAGIYIPEHLYCKSMDEVIDDEDDYCITGWASEGDSEVEG